MGELYFGMIIGAAAITLAFVALGHYLSQFDDLKKQSVADAVSQGFTVELDGGERIFKDDETREFVVYEVSECDYVTFTNFDEAYAFFINGDTE